MAYCVNCGVELAKSEPKCPLCGVESINPAEGRPERRPAPYPRTMERISKKMDRRYFALLAGLILLIPLMIVVICDLMISPGLDWSLYVIGALFMIFVWAVVPFYFDKYYPLPFVTLGCAVTTLYVFSIQALSGGSWFLKLGLPICLSASAFTFILTFIFTRKKRIRALMVLAAILFSLGLFTVCIDMILSAYAGGMPVPRWSLFVLIPCVILGLSSLILERRQDIKEQIRRRLFF